MRLSGRKARRVCARAARPPVSRPGSGVEPERQKIWLEDVVTFWSCLLAGWRVALDEKQRSCARRPFPAHHGNVARIRTGCAAPSTWTATNPRSRVDGVCVCVRSMQRVASNFEITTALKNFSESERKTT